MRSLSVLSPSANGGSKSIRRGSQILVVIARTFATTGLLFAAFSYSGATGCYAFAGSTDQTDSSLAIQKPEDPRLKEANTLEKRAEDLLSKGRPGEAVPLLRRALQLREAVLPPGHIGIGKSCNILAASLDEQGLYSEARPLYERALGIAEKVMKPDDPDLAAVLNNLGVVLGELGEYAAARPLFDRSLAIKEKVRGPDDPIVAPALENLARLLLEQEDTAGASLLYERALRIREKRTPDDPPLAIALNSLAAVKIADGDYLRAAQLVGRALSIAEKAQGPEHPNVATILNSMATLMGDTPAAQSLYERALRILEKAYGVDHPEVGSTLDNLANLFFRRGDYPLARVNFERALKIRERTLGQNHPAVARSLNNLAALVGSQGDYNAAKRYLETALRIFQQALGLDSLDAAACLNNIALFSQASGDIPTARSRYQQALAIWERRLGPDNIKVSVGLANLASLLQLNGDSKQAQQLLERALKIQENAGGPNSPDVARSLNNLGALHQQHGDYAKAELIYKQSLEVSKRAFDADHPMIPLTLDNVALMNWLQNDLTQARERFIRAAELVNVQTQRLLPALSLAEQRAFIKTQIPVQTSLLLSSAREGKPLQDAYGLVFKWKGLLLESLGRQTSIARLARDQKYATQAERLQVIRANLAGLYHKAGLIPLNQYQQKNEALTREKEALERELANAGTGSLNDPLYNKSLAQFQSMFAGDEAFIDLYRYSFFDGGKPIGDRFAAVLLSAKSGPRLVDLGEARAVNSAVTRWRSDVIAQKDAVDASWKVLVDLVWQPIATQLPPETRKIWLSPDGELARIPWQLMSLSDPKTQGLLLTQTDSAREVVRLRSIAATKTDHPHLLLAGSIDFNAGSGGQPIQEDFKPLDDTMSEVVTLRSIGERQGFSVVLLTKEEATKEAVTRELARTTIAHLATHGFFYQSRETVEATTIAQVRSSNDQSSTIKSERNPLVESGIALAGANIRDAATAGATGLLTAEEIVGLDLSRCELVVLSACNTGRGEEITGQGVMGLRAAVIGAGSRSVVMSLWKVSSEATSKLMTAFYSNLWVKKLPKAQALQQAQLELRDQAGGAYKRPIFWAGWVLAGEAW